MSYNESRLLEFRLDTAPEHFLVCSIVMPNNFCFRTFASSAQQLSPHHSKAPGTLHFFCSSCPNSCFSSSSFLFSSDSLSSLNPRHSFHTFSSSAYKSMTQGLQLLPQHSPAGGFSGLVSDVAAEIRTVSRDGAKRDFRSFRRVGEECFGCVDDMMGVGVGRDLNGVRIGSQVL